MEQSNCQLHLQSLPPGIFVKLYWIKKKQTIQNRSSFLGNAAKVQRLIDRGADIDLADGEGRSPLHIATIYGEEQAFDQSVRSDYEQ